MVLWLQPGWARVRACFAQLPSSMQADRAAATGLAVLVSMAEAKRPHGSRQAHGGHLHHIHSVCGQSKPRGLSDVSCECLGQRGREGGHLLTLERFAHPTVSLALLRARCWRKWNSPGVGVQDGRCSLVCVCSTPGLRVACAQCLSPAISGHWRGEDGAHLAAALGGRKLREQSRGVARGPACRGEGRAR